MYNWKLDNIDFEQYGVRVSRSRGLLDLPRMITDGYDWLDEHGKDYWQKAEYIKYGDREIVLDCYIRARAGTGTSAFEEFKLKLAAFYTAITSPGQKILTTPYGEIAYISLQQNITLPKRSQYVKSLQAGLFSLRLTVHGDSAFSLLTIAHKSGGYAAAVVKTNNLTVQRRLQGECFATCTTEVNEMLAVDRFDKVFLNFRGPGADTFYLDKAPELRKLSTNKYVYNFRFEHETNMLKNVAFLLNGEADFYWFANLEEIVDNLLANTARVTATSSLYEKGNIAGTLRKNHKFSGENCWQVLQRIVSEYEMEWGFEKHSLYGFYYINVAPKIEREWPFTLEYGKGKGLYELTRDAINTEELYTVVWAYGAAKNLKPLYGKQRLDCPGNPLKANTHLFGEIEKTHFFEDIYPRRTGSVTGYQQVLPPDLTPQQKEIWPGGIYRVIDNSLDFDINQYLLGGLKAKIRMKTGDLAGFEFEIEKYDHIIRSIYLIRFKDERGELFPNQNLTINSGDEYVLVDIGQPEEYVEDAEAELLAAGLDYLDEHSVPKVTYRAVVDPAFMQNNFDDLPDYRGFNVGDKIAIIDTDLGLSAQYRVSELSKNFHTGKYDLRLSESKILTQREVINQRLNAIETSLQDTRKDEVEQMRKDKETTAELRGRIFDPNDDLQAVDRTVRSESIDPRMLAFDAGVPQFSLRNALVEPNYQGDYNKMKVGAGQLIVQNMPESTLPRYEIKKLRDGGGHYDPTRTWTIPETILTLAGTGGYWLYCRLPLAPGASQATLFVEEDHVEVKLDIDDREIIYKLGHISDQSSPRYAAMLWGNVKYSSAGEQPEAVVINQPNHGFAKDQAIRHNGTIYVLAQADNDVNAQVCGIVSEVIDAHNFRYVTDGFLTGSWTAGAEYFLSADTPGLLITLPEPEVWAIGQVRISLGWGTSQGLKVEIDVGDLIEELPMVKLTGIWDREFEFCINQGYPETFTVDYWAVYPYTILELIIGVDNGSLPGSSIQINGVSVGGLENLTIAAKTLNYASGDNEVSEGMEVTLNTSGDYTGDPQVIKGKLKILRE